MASDTPEIILFHYNYSPYGRRVVWYLQLRGIKYTECLQPPILPRPDLASLNISYRRIPVLAIGRDIYCDTRAILSALEKTFPWQTSDPSSNTSSALTSPPSPSPSNPPSSPPPAASLTPLPPTLSPTSLSLPSLLSRLIIPGPSSLFSSIASLLPPAGPLMRDPAFVRDRTEFSGGRPWDADTLQKLRPEALVAVRDFLEILENTLLADGRKWLLEGPGSGNGSSVEGPTMADLEAVWVFHWIRGVPGALPSEEEEGGIITAERYPRVWAWIDRWDGVVKQAKKNVKVGRVDGEEARRMILGHKVAGGAGNDNGVGNRGSGFAETKFDERDPLGLKEETEVEVWATDSGMGHKDRGKLVGLGFEESVIEKEVDGGKGGKVRLHFPRTAFRVKEVGREKASL